MLRTAVLVLGAGPTGLGAAWRLHGAGATDWLLVDAAQAPGGASRSVRDDRGFVWDLGGHVVHSHFPVFDEVLRSSVEHWSAPRRSGWVSFADPAMAGPHDGWVPTPLQHHLGSLPARVREAAVAELTDPGRPRTDGPTFDDHLGDTFGQTLSDVFFRPFNRKMWGAPAHRLGRSWTTLRSGSRAANVPEPDLGPDRPHEPDDTAPFLVPTHGSGAIWAGVAARLPQEKLLLGRCVVEVHVRQRVVRLDDGTEIAYERLISSVPLTMLAARCVEEPALARTASELEHSSVHVVGLGFEGTPPPALEGVTYVYVPDASVPVHRATVLSNYSPEMAGPGRWSVLFEAGCSPSLSVSRDSVVVSALEQVRRWGATAAPVSVWTTAVRYGYPVPTLGRDRVLERLHARLEPAGVLSRGRFGGWRYESCNQDYAFVQGVEAVDLLLTGTPETTYHPGRRTSVVPLGTSRRKAA